MLKPIISFILGLFGGEIANEFTEVESFTVSMAMDTDGDGDIDSITADLDGDGDIDLIV